MNCKIELAFLFSLLYANKKIIVNDEILKAIAGQSICYNIWILNGFIY
jgi:hypothetical protein